LRQDALLKLQQYEKKEEEKKGKKEEKKRKKGQEGLLCFMLFSVERQRCCDSITKKNGLYLS